MANQERTWYQAATNVKTMADCEELINTTKETPDIAWKNGIFMCGHSSDAIAHTWKQYFREHHHIKIE